MNDDTRVPTGEWSPVLIGTSEPRALASLVLERRPVTVVRALETGVELRLDEEDLLLEVLSLDARSVATREGLR